MWKTSCKNKKRPGLEINLERSPLNIDFQWEMQFPPFLISKLTHGVHHEMKTEEVTL